MADAPTGQATPRPAWMWAVLVAVCVAAGAFGARLLTLGGPARPVRYSAEPRLDRAARAVTERADAKGRTAVVQGKLPMALPPLEAYLDREHIVRLAGECARLRRQALDAIASDAPLERRALEVAALSVFERGRLSSSLKVDAEQAQLVLYALDWPWVGPKAEDWRPAALPQSPPLPGDLSGCVALAEAAPAWPAAEQELEDKGGLSAEQALAVRAELLRRALARAFDSDEFPERAREALGKYADLAPQQADAVLAMAGAQALARAGEAALPALDVMARAHPSLSAVVGDAARGGGS